MLPARTDKGNVKVDHFGFPSSLVSPNEKGREWHLRFSQAFHGEYSAGGGTMLRYAMNDYEKYRSYARGSQPIDQYKTMISQPRRKGKKEMSWRNLDWNILPIIPTLKSVVKHKVLGQPKDIIVTAIDPVSQNEERVRYNTMLAQITNQPLYKKAQEGLGTEITSPMEPGTPMPQNEDELKLHLQMSPKDRYVMEVYDQIENTQNVNNWRQVCDDIVDDLIDVGVAGTKTYLDVTGVIRVRRVKPECVITNNVVNPDFSDATRIGEYITMSISELRASVPRGTFTEEDYAKMASVAGKTSYTTTGVDNYFRQYLRYPYDHEKVLVLDWETISADDFAYVVERSNGGAIAGIQKQKNPYWLDRVQWQDASGKVHTGVTDAQYVAFHQQRGSDRQVIRDGVNNLYGCKWVVGTEYIFDWGLKSNMQRSLNRLGDCRMNYNMYTFFDSYMRKAEPLADDIQRNWLHYQNMQNQARPSGLKINKRALTSLSVSGKGGMELDELDVLQMFAETGNLVYKGEDAAGRPYPFDPIQELKGGINEAAIQYWQFILQAINLLRTIFGLNEATDSSTPNPKLGKAIAEMLEQNTNTALGQVYYGYSKLYEETVKSIALLAPDASMIKSLAMDEALGESSAQFFMANGDLTFREYGIKIEDGPSNEARQRLQKYVELSIQTGELSADEGYLIEKEPNLMRAYHLLQLKRRQRQEQKMAEQQQVFEIENQKNIDSATATAAAKRDADLAILEAEVMKEERLHPLKMRELAATTTAQMVLKKMEMNAKLTEQDEAALAKFQETFLKTQSAERIAQGQQATQLRIAEENRKAAAKRASAAPKKK